MAVIETTKSGHGAVERPWEAVVGQTKQSRQNELNHQQGVIGAGVPHQAYADVFQSCAFPYTG